MALGAVGIGYQPTYTNQIIQTEILSPNLNGKVIPQPCISSGKVVHLCLRHKQILRSRTAVFATSNQSHKPEKNSQACTDGQIFITEDNHEISKDKQNMEVLASVSHAEEELFQKVEHFKTQGSILDKLKAVQLHVLASEQWNASRLKLCHRSYSVSAINLIHYLALKCLDVEQLKEDLSSIGLLNLETVNPCVLASLTAGINMLENLNSNTKKDISTAIHSQISVHKENAEYIINSMRKKVSSNRDLLLGILHDQRSTHIMVTVGQEATESDMFITDLLKTGTNIVRINCAHGNPTIWGEIIRRVKRSSQMLEKPCRVLMDLAGPKLRTGKLPSGPCVLKISPKKNSSGNITLPAQVWLSHKGSGSPPAHLLPDAVLFIDGHVFFSKLEVGDTVKFSDNRGKKKTLKIVNKCHVFGGTGFIGESATTTYVQSGTLLHIKGKKGKFSVGQIVDVPPVEQFVRLRIGDLLIISRDSSDEHDDSNGSTGGAHKITCNSGYLFDSVKIGDPIAFDDGKIWGVIQGNSMSEVIVSITHAGLNGTKLGSEKSINIPESNFQFEGLTSKDLMDLDFVAAHADMVGISFLRNTCDIIVLRQELEKRKIGNMGIVFKIETKSGFENLPLMLLEAMKSPNPLGVMIARGDLAVECGWERLADMQEEILSICSAAHIPVIWATQVLESLVKTGVPTRAEITDAASGRRASCIMLNKGKHIVKAVSTLDTILNIKSTEKMNAELKPLLLSSHLFQ